MAINLKKEATTENAIRFHGGEKPNAGELRETLNEAKLVRRTVKVYDKNGHSFIARITAGPNKEGETLMELTNSRIKPKVLLVFASNVAKVTRLEGTVYLYVTESVEDKPKCENAEKGGE